jgi:hypothetical protein
MGATSLGLLSSAVTCKTISAPSELRCQDANEQHWRSAAVRASSSSLTPTRSCQRTSSLLPLR